jgi:transcriptional regulator with XRE-family HTH domain
MVLFMDKKTVVLRVKLRRVSRGLSQEDLASAIGIDASQYSRIESGASDLNLTKLIKIMEKLEMKFSDFDDDDGTELPSTNTELHYITYNHVFVFLRTSADTSGLQQHCRYGVRQPDDERYVARSTGSCRSTVCLSVP